MNLLFPENMENGTRAVSTIRVLPNEILYMIFLLLDSSNLLSCRRVCRDWKDLLYSVKLWDKIPCPKYTYRGRLIWHFNPFQLASFLTRFVQLDLSFTNLPLDYVKEMTQALTGRIKPLKFLNLRGNNLYDLSYDDLEVYLKSALNINFMRCKFNSLQLRHMCYFLKQTIDIQSLDLSFVNLRGVSSLLLAQGLTKIKQLTLSKGCILRSQFKTILRYHLEAHQEWLFNLEVDHPYFHFSSPDTVTSKYFDLLMKELYYLIPHNEENDVLYGQAIYTIECKGSNQNCQIILK